MIGKPGSEARRQADNAKGRTSGRYSVGVSGLGSKAPRKNLEIVAPQNMIPLRRELEKLEDY